MARIRSNFKTGTISSLNNSTGLTLPTGGLGIAVGSGDYIAVTINPAPFGSTPSSEIVYLNGPIGATDTNIPTGQITRGAEGTSSSTTWATGTVWSHGATAQDFTLASGLINGDFPRPVASGQLFVSVASGNTLPVWTNYIPATTISGGTFPSSVTISGSQVVGNISATQISGGTVQSSVRISGGQIVGSNTISPSLLISGSNNTFLVTSGGSVGWAAMSFKNVAIDFSSTTDTVVIPYHATFTTPSNVTLGILGGNLGSVGAGTSRPNINTVLLQGQCVMDSSKPLYSYYTDIHFVYFAQRFTAGQPDGTYSFVDRRVGIAASGEWTAFNGSAVISNLDTDYAWTLWVGAYRKGGTWPTTGTNFDVNDSSATMIGINQ